MAVPNYTTDLTTITEATSVTGWDESSNSSWDDAGSMVDETNFYIQNNNCISAQFTKDGLGTILYEDGSTHTVPTDGAVLVWHFWASPPSLATLANGGVRVCIGNSYGDFKAWDVSGSDFEPAPLGGWWNFAVDPSLTADDTVGSVSSPYDTFGIAVQATAQARGNPNAVDVIRLGRCEARYNGGETSNYATFAGFGVVDNSDTNKWALLMDSAGGYRWQGLMTLGYTSAVDFRDSNRNIIVANTLNVSANFNKIDIRQATSNVEWTAISISALGTISKGRFEMIDNATVEKTSCTFTDMDTFIYQSNATLTTTTHRRCGLITQGEATMTGGTIDAPSGSVGITVNNLSAITKYNFNSDGTGHAIDMGNISGDVSYTWDNTDIGYASSDGSTGNETILVDVDNGITLTINKAGTSGSHPTVYNTGTGTVNVVASVSIEINVKDESGVDMQGVLVYVDEDLDTAGNIVNTTSDVNGDVSTSYSGGATTATIRARKYGYKPNVASIGLTANSDTKIIMISDPQQS